MNNRWDAIAPSSAATMPRVTVCVPARDPGDGLRRLLQGVAAQTYPAGLIDVVIADDCSSPPIELAVSPVPCVVERVPTRTEFGAGRARNLAASRVTGDLIVFLDADVVPEPTAIEAAVAATPAGADCVVLGPLSFSDGESGEGAHPDMARPGCHAEQARHGQPWRGDYVRRTLALLDERPDPWRIVVGALFAVPRDLFTRVGGFAELGVRGIEDIEFGYRLHNEGAFFVPADDFCGVHHGQRTMFGTQAKAIRTGRAEYAQALLPVGGFRSPRWQARHLGGSSAEALEFWVEEPRRRSASVASIHEHWGAVSPVAPGSLPTSTFAWVAVPDGVTIGPRTPQLVQEVLLRTGAAQILVPEVEGFSVTRTRALRRHHALGIPAGAVPHEPRWLSTARSLDLHDAR